MSFELSVCEHLLAVCWTCDWIIKKGAQLGQYFQLCGLASKVPLTCLPLYFKCVCLSFSLHFIWVLPNPTVLLASFIGLMLTCVPHLPFLLFSTVMPMWFISCRFVSGVLKWEALQFRTVGLIIGVATIVEWNFFSHKTFAIIVLHSTRKWTKSFSPATQW